MSHAQQRPPRQGHPWRALAVLAVLVVLAAVGTAVYVAAEHSTPAPGPVTLAPALPAVLGAAAPLGVAVPSIKATSSLIPLGLNPDRTLTVPPLSAPGQASWYDGSPQPGTRGPAVVLGHVNGNGKPGVFAHLADLKPGAEVDIARADHTTAVFTVDRVDTVPKTAFPTDKVFGAVPDAELRLITCGGDLDKAKHSYRDNTIAYAHLAGSRPS